MKLSALPYFGGKSCLANSSASKWIIKQLLPPNKKPTYVEPFAGMLGILLQRPRAAVEIVNDLNGEIVNWWAMVRDRGDELEQKLHDTPYSEKEFHMSYDDTDDLLEQARRTTIKLISGVAKGVYKTGFNVGYNGDKSMHSFLPASAKILLLQERIRKVVLLNRPAEKLLERLVNEPNMMIYCDPPYRTAITTPYGEFSFDHDLFGELMIQQKGAVAISGYNDEWDHLGWVRNEFQTCLSFQGPSKSGQKRPPRTEVLWTNYQPDISLDLFDGP